jgi:hypothetical protein
MDRRTLKIFLPHASMSQVESLFEQEKVKDLVTMQGLTQDWQSIFCEMVGYPKSHLPLTQLRMEQLDIDRRIKTIACCDPVMLDTSEHSTYMIGQSSLNWTHNDAIRIVSKINESLMQEGEQLYLIDKNAWLFTSQQGLDFSSVRLDELLGKDISEFSYQGKASSYFTQLGQNIQDLIKQMQIKQELSITSRETCLGVHFFDAITVEQNQALASEELEPIPFINNPNITLVSNNDLIKSFCVNTMLAYREFEQFDSVTSDECIVVFFETEQEFYPDAIQLWQDKVLNDKKVETQIILQDRIITQKVQSSWLKRAFG